ncbi:MAG: 3-deoxy-8-phosphooctulonate synthase [Armatimonadota bacterium]|nr:3-deoxy-8-phosphooctulonate synthase [Armatimonadota bacterium]MCX7777223.1 3-deoxy-8-phosphooctulonate synthase [Armatimonadota bacterium]MDW8024638.1 3-deoxy-8-phosphooctulonate synthase [Armatimonadota bacterium]
MNEVCANEKRIVSISNVRVGAGELVLIAGPCAIESETVCMHAAEFLKALTEELNMPFIFKASYDKANRTSLHSFRGLGMKNGLCILSKVKSEFGIPVLTDVHCVQQVDEAAEVADVLQVPAFLCRQTDLLIKVGKSGRAVNIKKGQFVAPEDMRFAIEKVTSTGNHNVMVTERGTTFGYHDLVVDMRSIVIMRSFGYPVVFDATHSVQQPGAAGGSSGGRREFVPYLARAAVAVGIDALFLEVHPSPDEALSDGPNMLPLSQLKPLLQSVLAIHEALKFIRS